MAFSSPLPTATGIPISTEPRGTTVMRRKATGSFELPIPSSEAIGYFTPEGERDWAPGWDPSYPAGEASEIPGTVFVTSHGHDETIWTIHRIDRTTCTAAYTRHNVGKWAGTVRVRCEDTGSQGCKVTVDYDTTVLPGGDPSVLHHFDQGAYGEMMNHWSEAIRRVI